MNGKPVNSIPHKKKLLVVYHMFAVTTWKAEKRQIIINDVCEISSFLNIQEEEENESPEVRKSRTKQAITK